MPTDSSIAVNGSGSNTSGDNQAKFRLKPAKDTDRIPAWLADELVARGYVVVDVVVESNVVVQPLEPEDKTKIWYFSDVVNGIPQGQAKIYNAATGKWETISQSDSYVPPLRRNGQVSAVAGQSQMSVGFESLQTNIYHITMTPTTIKGDGTGFATPPATIPLNGVNPMGFIISNIGENTFTINFYGVPTGGLTYLWEATVIPNA